MKVLVDELRCDAHGLCVEVCPEVFALDDDDDVVTVVNSEPEESLRDKLFRAEQQCPKAAITVNE